MEKVWVKIAQKDELPDGRVASKTIENKFICLVHYKGRWAAMDNHCPHQGGPLGEGSIECNKDKKCYLRCPWHGWDFDPITGIPPGGHEDTGQKLYPVEEREDGIYIEIEREKPHQTTVTDVMSETMINWGTKRVFGIVGHSNLGLADALRRQEKAGKLNYIGVRHEGAAAFAASAYGKLTGIPAACLTIAGPGATNLLTGLWDAKVDHAPVIALTGQVQTQVFGPGAFQDIDLLAAFEAVSDFSQPVLVNSKHAELMSLACKNAIVNRSVSHLVFPDDIQTQLSNEEVSKPKGRVGRNDIRASKEDIESALKLIKEAKRPIIIMGNGAAKVNDKVIAFAEKLGAPVMTTFRGKGLIADSHPNSAGVLGRSGTPIASWFMNECDLIITLGSSFSNHTGITPKRKIIQVDFDQMQLGKFHSVELPIWGEIGMFCDEMLSKLDDYQKSEVQLQQLKERWAIWREEKERRLLEKGQGVHSAAIFKALTNTAPEDAIICVDVGNNTYSFGRYFEIKGQRVLMSGYLGSIGFSFPAAIGAWSATQDFEEFKGRKVISISGDGGFGQYPMDFTTAVKYNMNITHILLNNGELGKISKEQRSSEHTVWETDLHNPSFAEFAKICGGKGILVKDASQLELAMKEAFEHNGPTLIEIMSDALLV